jgi:hypothetical protein
MLIADKTQVEPGDNVNYGVIYRHPGGGLPTEELSVAWGIWDPQWPRLYSKFGIIQMYDTEPAKLIDLGNGFYLRKGTFTVPSGIANANPTSGAIRMFAQVRKGDILEQACITIPLGETKRALLINTTWDGFPGSWSDIGLGPCNFYRENTFLVRYPDYRDIKIKLYIKGRGTIDINPKKDTAHVPDADDAIFVDRFFYDGQCESQYRNIPFRDPVRTQPPKFDFSGMPIQDPPMDASISVAAMEPLENQEVTSPVRFYYFVDRAGIPGPEEVTLVLDGKAVVTGSTNVPIKLEIEPGTHEWHIEALENSGKTHSSEERHFIVKDGSAETAEPVTLGSASLRNDAFDFQFKSVPGLNYIIEKATAMTDWQALVRTNAATNSVLITQPARSDSTEAYRVRSYPAGNE